MIEGYAIGVCMTLNLLCDSVYDVAYIPPTIELNKTTQCGDDDSLKTIYCKKGLTYYGMPKIDINLNGHKIRMKYRSTSGVQITYFYNDSIVVERKEENLTITKIFHF